MRGGRANSNSFSSLPRRFLPKSVGFCGQRKIFFFQILTSCTVKPACICIYILFFFWEEKSSHTLGSKGRGQKPDNYCPFAGRKGNHLTTSLLLLPWHQQRNAAAFEQKNKQTSRGHSTAAAAADMGVLERIGVVVEAVELCSVLMKVFS